MFYATLSDGNEYKFLFAFPDKHEGKKQRRTLLLVFLNKRKVGLAESKVNLSAGDRFNKDEGRKYALRNLLNRNNLFGETLSRENRTEIWDQFWAWNASRYL